MNKEKILIVGGGGHALSSIDIIESVGRFEIAGIIDSGACSITRYPLLGNDEALPELVSNIKNVFIAVGQIKSYATRLRLVEKLKNLGAVFPTIISPRAYVSSEVSFGEGCFVGHMSVINSKVKVGNFCIINSCALLEHGVSVQDFCHISTGAIVNGDAMIGYGTFLGSGAIVREGISIKKDSIISMGERVISGNH